MTKDVIAMAREAGATPYTSRHYPDRPTHTFNVEQLEKFATLVGNAKLEEAATEMQGLYSLGGDDIAAVLRAMKEPTTVGQDEEPSSYDLALRADNWGQP